MAGVTLQQFFSAVLKGLGAPVTQNNLTKLAAVARQEGGGGSFNPFNYVVGPGTNFNSVGVKNYPDVQTGIAQTIKLLSQKNTGMMRANLMADDPTYNNWLTNVSNFYKSWGGGAIKISQPNAAAYLGRTVQGATGDWTGEMPAGASPFKPISSPLKPISGQSSLAPLTYHNWVTQGWAATNQYTGLSPWLSGLMGDLLKNYGGQNLGGYGRRGIKSNPALPSAHAAGAAIDWGYGTNRAIADKVIAMITSDPNRYGIQELHDYSGMRDWRIGRGWLAQARGSHGGDMQPGSHWLHLEVSPDRYHNQFGQGGPSGPSGPSGAVVRSHTQALALASMMSSLTPKFTPPAPGVSSFVAAPHKPMTATSMAGNVGKPPADISYYAGGKVQTAAQQLAAMIPKTRSVLS
jgi:hypothetical protein